MSVQAVEPSPAAQSASDISAAEPPREIVQSADQRPTEPLVESDLLVEDVSIDGMCGVY